MKASLLLSLGLLLAILASPSTTAEDGNQNPEGDQAESNSTETTKAPEPSTNSTTKAPEPSANSTTKAPEPSANSTTKAPEPSANSTTKAPEPSANSTTKAPEPSANSTTKAPEPSANSTTKAPEPSANSTTKAPEPSANSTTKAPEPSANSTTKAPEPSANSTTKAPEPSANATTKAPEPSANSTTKAPEPSANSTTKAPEPSANSTTKAPEPSANSTTKAPEPSANATTKAPEPSANSTTKAPEPSANSTTKAPELSANSTTKAPDLPSNSTEPTKVPDLPGNSTEPTKTPDPAGNSTQPPMTTESPGDVSSQTTSPGKSPQDPCKPNPCGGSASCVKLNTEWFCVCPEGSYYQNASASCEKGKTFPGEIGVRVPETTGLDNKTSPAYQALYSKVVKFFQKAFNVTEAGSDYGQTIILKVSFSVSSSQSTRSAMRAEDGTIVNVSVVNMFSENTTQTESTISAIIEKAVTNDNAMENYSGQDLCDHYGCEKNDEGCQNPLQCTCKTGFTRWSPQNPFCLPLECSRSCSAEEKKQCLKNGDGPLKCACMPGYQNSTDGKCEPCPFGYSGQDCKDPFQLILTIVGTIAGALILILLIAFIVSVSSKNKKKNVEEQKLIDEDYQNVRMQQTGFSNSGFNNSGFSNSRFSNSGFSNNSDFSNFGAGNSIFPKVKTQNPYANQRSMPRPDY